MTKQVKLIWDFRGGDAFKIAEHHQIHLDQFIKKEGLELLETGIHKMSDMHSIAFMMVTEAQMIMVRDALKPHRGELITLG